MSTSRVVTSLKKYPKFNSGNPKLNSVCMMISLENVFNVSLQDDLKMSWRRLQNALKTSWRCLEDVFARRLEDVLKTSWRLLKTFWRRLEDVLKTILQTSWKCLENVLKTSWRRLEDVLKTYDQDEYIGLDQDALKTFSKRLEDVFWRWRRKRSSRRLDQDESGRIFDGLYLKTSKWHQLRQ